MQASPLRNLRRARGISQEQLAAIAGVTQETISKAERGVLRLSSDVQERIATILGGTRLGLFGAEPVTDGPDSPEQPTLLSVAERRKAEADRRLGLRRRANRETDPQRRGEILNDRRKAPRASEGSR